MTEAGSIRAAMNAHPRPNDAWLRTHVEEAIDPDVEVVDPHHHFVDEGPGRYTVADTVRDFVSGHKVSASVHMQCQAGYRTDGPEALKPVGETEYVRDLTTDVVREGRGQIVLAAGIVGSVDLMLGDGVMQTLEAHLAEGLGRFKGVRPSVVWHADPRIRPIDNDASILGSHQARQAISKLAPLDLSLDLWVFFTQLSDVAAICRRFPDTRIVVDHCGGPLGIGDYAGNHDKMFRAWRAAVEDVAQHENTVLKFGGLGMRYPGFSFDRRLSAPGSEHLATCWRSYFEVCLNAFGPDRMMFESNFPIDRGMFSYCVLWNAFKRLAGRCSGAECEQLFSKTAKAVYRLEVA